MHIQKQLGYKVIPKIAYPEIDRLINQVLKNKISENKTKTPANNVFNKWIMPEEQKGYLHAKTNDPL